MHKQKQQALERKNHYNSNPKRCEECIDILPYEKRNNKFCSKSCSATFSNRKRIENGWIPSEDQRIRISEALKGRPGHSKNKGKEFSERKNVICSECGSTFRVTISNKQKYCSVECRSKHMGGVRERSGYSKSGYYKGIYCGSSYELVWVIYRLDHKLSVTRFDGFIFYGDNKKYFPDFVEGNIIHEMKGWTTSKTDPVLLAKESGANKAGYIVKMYFKEDLQKEFDWVKTNYSFKKIEELYDGYKPKYEIICRNCGIAFLTDNKKRKCCSHKCSGQPKSGYKISHSSSGKDR